MLYSIMETQKMRKHNERCEMSKRKQCKCRCEGKMHGIKAKDSDTESFDKEMNESMGGEVAAFIQENKGKEYYCFGPHKNPEEDTHIATTFMGYPHDDGLSDASGKKWWVYVVCDNPVGDSGHQTSFVHFPNEVERAKRSKELNKV